MTMHAVRIGISKEAAPCDTCANRKICASRWAACDAFSLYSNGKPMRMWRDADRTPLSSIAVRLVRDWQEEKDR